MFALGIGFGLITAAVLAISALGFDLTVAVSGVLNVGFVSFMLIGQFLAYGFETITGQLWSAIVIASALSGVAGLVLYQGLVLPFLRRKTPQFVIVLLLLGVASVVQAALSMVEGSGQYNYTISSGLQRAMHPLGMLFTVAQMLVVAAAVTIVVLVDGVLRHTRLGRDIRAIADNGDLASSFGVPVAAVTRLTWIVSGVLGGLSGMLLAIEEVSFSTTTDQSYFVLIIAAAFLGGAGKPYGAAIGALVIGLVVQISGIWIRGDLTPLIAFAALLFVIIVRPQGVLGAAKGELRA